MTIIFSLVLLLLFLSLHACNARNHGVLHHHHPAHHKSHFPITKEKDEKVINPGGCVSMQAAERKISVVEAKSSDDEQKNLEVRDFRKNWRVPHKKRGERQPGFNLDYLPPRTHPPVHN